MNTGHKETRSNRKMQTKSDKELLDFIKSGSLSHAAARYELVRRGKAFMMLAV